MIGQGHASTISISLIPRNLSIIHIKCALAPNNNTAPVIGCRFIVRNFAAIHIEDAPVRHAAANLCLVPRNLSALQIKSAALLDIHAAAFKGIFSSHNRTCNIVAVLIFFSSRIVQLQLAAILNGYNRTSRSGMLQIIALQVDGGCDTSANDQRLFQLQALAQLIVIPVAPATTSVMA